MTIAGKSLSVKITNTFPGTLESIRDVFGGALSTSSQPDPRHRTQYTLSLYGDNAAAMLRALIPHLREKQGQAHLALLWRELPKGDRKEALRGALSDLKRTSHTPRKPA